MKRNFQLTIAAVCLAWFFTSCSKGTSSGGNGGGGIGNDSTIYSTKTGTVSTLAGNGSSGLVNGTGTAAEFSDPIGVAVDRLDNVYVLDGKDNVVRKITPAGVVTTLAGNGKEGYVDGAGVNAEFESVNGIAADASGNVFVSEGTANMNNNRIRSITPAGVVSTLAGNGNYGLVNGLANGSKFNSPAGMAVNGSGIFIADQGNNVIRSLSSSPLILNLVSTFVGSGTQGYVDGAGAFAEFNDPIGLAFDVNSNLYVTDFWNCSIRKISSAGIVTTLAGRGKRGIEDGPPTLALFEDPQSLVVDNAGEVYVVSGSADNRIRIIGPGGAVATLSGTLAGGFADGPLSSAIFNDPSGIAIDGNGNLYVADHSNFRIRKISIN